MSKVLIKNIRELFQVGEGLNSVKGKAMDVLPSIKNAYLAIEENTILSFGSMDQLQGISDWTDLTVIDAQGKFVLPCWCDSHSHLVYAQNRETEFIDRMQGLTYQQIAENGGGILNSALKLRAESEENLYASASKRVKEIMALGTGAVEVKSGYGLDLESEIKMLKVIKRLKENFPITIKSTFLGAHAIPLEYKNNRGAYIDLITNTMLPEISNLGLADFIDVFCDKGFFTPEETETILLAGKRHGLKAKIHANELALSGGIEVGVHCEALSVDHLEFTEKPQMDLLKKSATMPTLLPGTAFFLGLEYAPARKMIDYGLPLALASDYNPGSSPSGNMWFVAALAGIKMKMSTKEIINAMTINAAIAMGVEKTQGSIHQGKIANIIITKELSSLDQIPYSFGSNLVEQILIQGRIVKP